MKLKIGVMGSATGEMMTSHSLAAAFELGKAVAEADCHLITGGCPGLPLEAARGAKSRGGLVIGISPGLRVDEHVRKYQSPTEFHDVLVFTGSGLMGREVVNIRSSDIVVFAGGSSGTLGELAIAYDEGKLIGVLRGTGGISDIAESILAACKKETGARLAAWVRSHDSSKTIGENPHLTALESTLDCASCHATKDRHWGLFGRDCAACHATSKWTVAGYLHPSPRSTDCAQCHKPPPSHFMGHFAMVSRRVAGRPEATVQDCYVCHQTTAWNDIKAVGLYKHH